jgi:hypothetical protein
MEHLPLNIFGKSENSDKNSQADQKNRMQAAGVFVSTAGKCASVQVLQRFRNRLSSYIYQVPGKGQFIFSAFWYSTRRLPFMPDDQASSPH